LPSTLLTRWNIRPVTWQCAGTGVPATLSVPAATALAAVNVVLANASRVVRSVHEVRLAPVAAGSCGSDVAAAGGEGGDQQRCRRGGALQAGEILHVHISCVRTSSRHGHCVGRRRRSTSLPFS
jgi:hypothetical protein